MSTKLPWNFIEPKVCFPTGEINNSVKYEDQLYNEEKKNKSRLVRCITNDDQLYSIKILKSLSNVEIDESFSWKKNGGDKIEKPRNQGSCGCCWSMAVSSVLGDRYSIKYNIPSLYPSATWLIVNTYKDMDNLSQDACDNGGDPITAIEWLYTNGNKVEECWPFELVATHNYITPNSLPDNCCMTCCDPEYTKPFSNTLLTVKPNSLKNLVVIDDTGYYINEEATIRLIQNEIKINGPVVTTFRVYKDFNTYWKYAKNGSVYIFDDTPSNYTGGHAVVITGWSTELIEINTGIKKEKKTVRCWEVRNSWGNSGDDGYCKIAFSLDVEANKMIELDIPRVILKKTLNTSMICSGGVISFSPGDLPESAREILNIKKPIKLIETVIVSNNKNNIWIKVLIGILIIIGFFFIFYTRRFKSSTV